MLWRTTHFLKHPLKYIQIHEQLLLFKRIMSCFYHYTNFDTFFNMLTHSIIVDKDTQAQYLEFWATWICAMNDTAERDLYIGELLKRVKQYAKDKNAPLTAEQESILQRQISMLDEIYVISLSGPTSVDNIDMWRAYGGNGTGICIGIDFSQVPQIISTNDKNVYQMETSYSVKQCQYCMPDKIKINKGLIEKAYNYLVNSHDKNDCESAVKKAGIIKQITEQAAYYKHPAYKSENEWRIITFSCGDEVLFRKQGNAIKPYIKINIPLSAISSIMIGPCIKNAGETDCVVRMIKRIIGPNISILYSKIPYRG